jgi:hypothetical protein
MAALDIFAPPNNHVDLLVLIDCARRKEIMLCLKTT